MHAKNCWPALLLCAACASAVPATEPAEADRLGERARAFAAGGNHAEALAAYEQAQTSEPANARWPLERPPHMLETCIPGVFAVGDVRSGNVKRIASAVGEGAICVQLVHRSL